MERKDFLKKLTIGSSVLFAAPLILGSCTKEEGDVDDHNNA